MLISCEGVWWRCHRACFGLAEQGLFQQTIGECWIELGVGCSCNHRGVNGGKHGGDLLAAEGAEEFLVVANRLGRVGEGLQLGELGRDGSVVFDSACVFPFVWIILDVRVCENVCVHKLPIPIPLHGELFCPEGG